MSSRETTPPARDGDREAARLREQMDGASLSPNQLARMRLAVDEAVRNGPSARAVGFSYAIAGGLVLALAVLVLMVARSRHGRPVVLEGGACAQLRGDAVSAAADCGSSVLIALADDRIELAPGAAVERTSAGVRMKHGVARFNVRHRPRGERFTVSVSAGLVVVTGTEFEVEQRADGGTLQLYSGKVEVRWWDGGPITVLAPGERLEWPRRQAQAPAAAPAESPAPTLDPAPEPTPATAPPAKTNEPLMTPPPRETRPVDLPAIIARLYQLRSQQRDHEAAAMLRQVLARRDLSTVERTRLSYELGVELEDRLQTRDQACAHWRAHQQQHGASDPHAADVAARLARCEP